MKEQIRKSIMKITALTVMIGVLLITGCTSDDMADYFAAIDLASAEKMGTTSVDFYAELNFNEEGLDSEKLRELSYFDVIQFSMKDKFQEPEDGFNLESMIYYNLGGIGFDMDLFIENDKMYMKMPVQDKYLDLSEAFNSDEEKTLTEDEQMYVDVFKPVIDEWKNILKVEDIVRGEKTYVLTEQGQIKATTYNISIDEEQLTSLSETLISQVNNEDIMDAIFSESEDQMSEEEVQEVKDSLMNTLNQAVIKQFDVTAFVDFDGRMVKQSIEFELDFGDVDSGQIQNIEGVFTIENDEFGEEQTFDFPVISEDQWITEDDTNGYYQDMFPAEITK